MHTTHTKQLLLTIAALAALAMPARGADLPPLIVGKAPTVAIWSWQDCYLGMVAGGATSDKQTGTPVAGGIVGCNYQSAGSPFVYGFEGDASAAQASAGIAPSVVDIKSLTNLALRVGYAWHGALNFGPIVINDALLYAKVAMPTNFLQPLNAGAITTETGWGLAGGVEYIIRPNVASRLEYEFQDINGRHAHVMKQMLVLYYAP
jgi:opacity protein-like surface antigen